MEFPTLLSDAVTRRFKEAPEFVAPSDPVICPTLAKQCEGTMSKRALGLRMTCSDRNPQIRSATRHQPHRRSSSSYLRFTMTVLSANVCNPSVVPRSLRVLCWVCERQEGARMLEPGINGNCQELAKMAIFWPKRLLCGGSGRRFLQMLLCSPVQNG